VDYQVQREQALATIRVSEEDEDRALMEILGGELVNKYVYSFPQGGTTILGLSFAGYREWASWRGNFKMDKPEVEDLGDEFRVMVQVHDLERNVSIWAGTHQPKMQTFRDRNRKPEPDPYAYEKAISKAQRNALKNLMPVTMVEAAIAKFTALPAGGSQQGPQRAIKGSQPNNRSKGTGAIPDGPAKGLGDLYNWSKDSFGATRTKVLQINGVAADVDIADADVAWKKVVAHFAALGGAQGATEAEEPATEQSPATPADYEAIDYPQTETEFILRADQAYRFDMARVELILGIPISKVQDLEAAWDQIVMVAAAAGPDGGSQDG